MGIFGWSYPPGCNGTPWDEDYPCEVCGQWEQDCLCPECPECGDFGNPECYEDHGLVKTQAQIDSLVEKEKEWEDNARSMDPCEEDFCQPEGYLGPYSKSQAESILDEVDEI